MASFYVHIPFCSKKCFYCSFVVSIGQEKRIDDYLQCLLKEVQQYPKKKVQSLYFGGGTPSFLNKNQIQYLFDELQSYLSFDETTEVTFEANPETCDEKKLRLLKQLGVNRISLGVQSLSNSHLEYLGRNHDSAIALKAFEDIRTAGFHNVNIDLMHSFLNQTQDQIKEDVEAICALGSEHVSLYALDIEENSRFFTKKYKLPSNEQQAQNYQLVVKLLKAHGLKQYEVSNFAKSGFESRHNLNYWKGGNYIGLGIGAHSHMDGLRRWNVTGLADYIARVQKGESPKAGEERLEKQDQFKEMLLFGLRMNAGVDLSQLENQYAIKLDDELREHINTFVESKYLDQDNGRLWVTDKGRLVLDELCAKMI